MPKVLVIDDDPQLRDIYTTEFQRLNFEVVSAGNGQEGINSIKANMPDIVLLDLIMPEKSGFEVLEMAKADSATKNIPVLVLTNIMADFEDLLKQGAADCLLKVNQTPGDIAKKVKEILARDGKIALEETKEEKKDENVIDFTTPQEPNVE